MRLGENTQAEAARMRSRPAGHATVSTNSRPTTGSAAAL